MGIENKDKNKTTSLFDPLFGIFPNLHPIFNKAWVQFFLFILVIFIIANICQYFGIIK